MEKTVFDFGGLRAYREDNQLEVKSSQGGLPDSLWDTYSAFANTDGGCILLGVKERADGSLYAVGLKNAEKLRTDFWNAVNNRQKISVNLMTERRVRVESVEGKDVLVLEVPRADRAARPVFRGQDPRTGTFRRNGSGDYRCSLEEVSALFRDAALVPQDAKVLKEMDMSVFCMETIRGYRQLFRDSHPGHVWNNLEDEVFLRRIGAMAFADDGSYHPTAAGLLMFGYEFEIVREFPQYFLDFQENRQMLKTRWTDRIVSSSGDWSGNVFDFVFRVVPKLTSDLKVPFVLKGMQRIDDTPVHKILREAVTNACVHADFYGRRGLVVQKNADGFVFANPGSMRVPRSVAVEGGVSDPRNGVMLKIFSLVNYGERAGSGLSSVIYVWNKVFHASATIAEEMGVERVVLTLNKEGHEQDIAAMLELYDDPEELTFGDLDPQNEPQRKKYDTQNGEFDTQFMVREPQNVGYGPQKQGDDPQKGESDSQDDTPKSGDDTTKEDGIPKIVDKLSIKDVFVGKLSTNLEIIDKLSINDRVVDKFCEVLVFVLCNPHARTEQIAQLLGLSISRAKQYLQKLTEFGFVTREGANKNRTYSASNELLRLLKEKN